MIAVQRDLSFVVSQTDLAGNIVRELSELTGDKARIFDAHQTGPLRKIGVQVTFEHPAGKTLTGEQIARRCANWTILAADYGWKLL